MTDAENLLARIEVLRGQVRTHKAVIWTRRRLLHAAADELTIREAEYRRLASAESPSAARVESPSHGDHRRQHADPRT
jgi:hypothetical protein